MSKKIVRMTMAGSAIAAVLVGVVPTAASAEPAAGISVKQAVPPAPPIEDKVIKLPNGRGSMTFYDDGDQFTVCDTRADAYPVTGQLVQNNGTTLMTIYDDGDAGCDTKGYDIPMANQYQMQLWWHGGGAAVYSHWFNE